MISSGLIENYREVVRTGVPFTCEVFIDDDMIKATWINVPGRQAWRRDRHHQPRRHRAKRLNDHVSYLAHYDQLTGLANRTRLQDRLHQAILRSQRHKQKVAVFMVDIDHFKRINDSLGHADGDALLTAVGKRLLSCVRETDTIARMGGDEFVVVMPDFTSLEDVERCGRQIVNGAARPITIGDREINITVSVGLCIYPDCGLEADQLLKNADAAMYVVKDTGRNGLQIFTESMMTGDSPRGVIIWRRCVRCPCEVCFGSERLKEKLLQLPAGSTFDFAWQFDERDEREILEISQFPHSHGFTVIKTHPWSMRQ
jgi:diguanylate cyclase (GGDEF)-like protein